jgi:phage baseplate assembly protein V
LINTDALRAVLTPLAHTDRFYGVVVGVVTNNQDPENMHRVKVHFPWLGSDVESNWARVAAPMSGNDRGAYFLPEVGDEVLVAFEHGQVDHPFVLGSLWNGQDSPPESNADGENNHRTIKSRSGHVLRLNDKSGNETIEIIDKSGKNRIIIDTAKNSITIEADADITIKSATGKLTMQANGIEMKSQMGISAEAATNMDLKANALVTVKGSMIRLN